MKTSCHASGAAPRFKRANIPPEGPFQNQGETLKSALQSIDNCGIGTFLRSEHCRRTARTEQGRLDIAQQAQRAIQEGGIQPRNIDGLKIEQRLRPILQIVPMAVQKADSERAENSGSSVDGGPPAEAQDDFPGVRASGPREAHPLPLPSKR